MPGSPRSSSPRSIVMASGSAPMSTRYERLLGQVEMDVIASGGVGSLDHLRELAALTVGGRRLEGVIVGRALYDGSFTIDDALRAVAARPPSDSWDIGPAMGWIYVPGMSGDAVSQPGRSRSRGRPCRVRG